MTPPIPADGNHPSSANNRPRDVDRPLGLFYSPDDRCRPDAAPLAAEIGTFENYRDALVRLQTDAVSEPARRLAQGLADRLVAVPGGAGRPKLARRLAAWDGGLMASSRPAPSRSKLLLAETVRALYGEGEGEDRTVPGVYAQWRHPCRTICSPISTRWPRRSDRRCCRWRRLVALDRAAGLRRVGARCTGWRCSTSWGNLPVIGGRLRFDEVPVPGSRETLWKSAHDLVDGRHDADYGAQSRHISDMADLDANWFVLLGGNDGWLGSTTFLDQVPLFLEGEMIRLPLRPETVVRNLPPTRPPSRRPVPAPDRPRGGATGRPRVGQGGGYGAGRLDLRRADDRRGRRPSGSMPGGGPAGSRRSTRWRASAPRSAG